MFTQFCQRDIAHFSQVFSIFQATLISFAIPLMLFGCGEDDNPIVDEHEHQHEENAPVHAEADGILLKVDGVEVYRQFQGTQTGALSVSAGKEIMVHVTFLAPNGSEFLPGGDEEEHEHDEEEHEHDEEEMFSLSITGYDGEIIEIHRGDEHEGEEAEQHEGEKAHHEEVSERFTFEVVGVKVGTTRMTIQLLHGEHADFTALPTPVTVQ